MPSDFGKDRSSSEESSEDRGFRERLEQFLPDVVRRALEMERCVVQRDGAALRVRLPEGVGTDAILRATREAKQPVRHMAHFKSGCVTTGRTRRCRSRSRPRFASSPTMPPSSPTSKTR